MQLNLLNKTISASILGAVLATSVAFAPVQADEAADKQKGFDIAARSDRSDNGFTSSEVEAIMTLVNAAGRETTRELSFKTLERENEDVGDKGLTVFSTPRDVKGTALLSHAKILEPDNQWLYLPALKRVKRISSANKSGPFVGSEFAFEDFTSTELNKYEYKYIGEETLDGMKVDVVERFPRYKNSGYTRQVSYIDQDVYQVRKIDFYDRKNALLKTLNFSDYKEYDNGIWRAHTLAMTNHQTNKSTTLTYGEYKFKTGLADKDFVKGVLKRVR
ncbi:outer membrane lipoprotein-sorting protein [Kordiimonas sp. SCSIO 12603]|uniref:outer membrane lipoprotein-sorting protein n=1 Tax=Kordiimonas sp. SCSIO 12603 TaxID=2829596 RepID=UPI0021023915|nr:outer membrane lipoprotein-sorting protein [Kordiimonas sp. SCSIO 12603]UTW58283.1 outer membrane lipoprotein-sorting protein [Kordiimonas sp. SCSIO 12603]